MKKSVFAIVLTVLVLALCSCRKEEQENLLQRGEQIQTTVPGVAEYQETPGNPLDEEDDEVREPVDAATEATEAEREKQDPTAVTETTASAAGAGSSKDETAAPTEAESGKDETAAPTGGKQDEVQPTEATKPAAPGEETEITVTYEQYQAMSAQEQTDFFNSFADPADFFAWQNAAKAEYDAAHPNIDVGDGSVDLGEIAGGE